MKFRRFVLALLVLALSVSFLAITASAAVKKPAAPELKVSNVASSGEIKLTWSKVEGAKNYQIYRASSKTGTFKKIKTTTSASFTNTEANPGDTYWYYVKAVSAKGIVSKNSNKVSATCKLPRPEVTLSNSASSGKIQVSWKPVAGAQKYRVYRATSKSGEYTVVRNETTTSFVNTSTTAGKTYYYKVVAVASKSAANSAYSTVKSRMCDLARPSIKLENVASSGKVKVSWNAVEGAVKYQVYRSLNQKSWTLLNTTTSLSMVNNNGKAGTNYYYRVRAVASNTEANSAYSNVKNRMCDLPRPELTLTNDAVTGRVKLDWTAVEGAVAYKVFRATSKNGEYKWIKETKETSYIDKSAEAEKTYYYKIRAYASNADADSAYSAVKSGSYQYKTSLEVSIALNEEGKPQLTWNEVSGAVKYNVYRSVTKNGTYKLLSTTTNKSMTNANAASGVTFYYKVAAVDVGGKEIKISAVVSIKTALPEGEVLVKKYTVNPTVYLYELPDSSTESIIIPYMSEVKIGLAVSKIEAGTWYRAFYKDKLYYAWLEAGTEKFTTEKSTFTYTGNTQYQQAVLDLAMYIHDNWKTVYVHGQSNGVQNADGTYGFDCSGFATYVLNTVMQKTVPFYKLTSNITGFLETDCVYNAGYPGEFCAVDVALEDIEPGDIVFFSQEEPFDHCGIYLGNGEFIQSNADWENSVNIMPLSGWYLNQVSVIRRYLPKSVKTADTEETIGDGCFLYSKTLAEESARVVRLAAGEKVTILYTNCDNWAYVSTQDGTKGYLLVRNLA